MNMKKLLIGSAIRLKYVTRFSTCRTLHKESVAEHCYYTALYSLVLAKWVECQCNISVDVERLLSKALIHDLEEAITGDIPRDFKYMNEDLHKHIETVSEIGFQKVSETVFQNYNPDHWLLLWRTAKDDTIEGKILSFADFLSVISYVYEEIRIAYSISLKEHLTALESYYNLFTTKEYSFLHPLVVQIDEILKEIFNETK